MDIIIINETRFMLIYFNNLIMVYNSENLVLLAGLC
jgi:hypothetical protein